MAGHLVLLLPPGWLPASRAGRVCVALVKINSPPPWLLSQLPLTSLQPLLVLLLKPLTVLSSSLTLPTLVLRVHHSSTLLPSCTLQLPPDKLQTVNSHTYILSRDDHNHHSAHPHHTPMPRDISRLRPSVTPATTPLLLLLQQNIPLPLLPQHDLPSVRIVSTGQGRPVKRPLQGLK